MVDTSTATAGVVLFAHGARDPQWAQPFRSIREQVRVLHPDARVELAFLELMAPDLTQCVQQMIGQGIRHVSVVPLFMAQGGHLKEDLPVMVQRLQAAHPEVTIHVTPAIGESPMLLAAIAGWVVQQTR